MKIVRVFCPICRAGNNSIWTGSLEEWKKELLKDDPPDWANYAHRHENAHGHRIMVEYPSGLKVFPFKVLSEVKR